MRCRDDNAHPGTALDATQVTRRVQAFGGAHTELKLQVVMAYLVAYLKVMHRQPFRLTYIDAFAGTGWRRASSAASKAQASLLGPDESVAAVHKGSPLRVLELAEQGRRFDRLVFGDLSRDKLAALSTAIVERYRDETQGREIEFRAADANALIEAECARMGPRDRAVMFLDPFGMHVNWASIEAVARSGKIDLWYLAPTGAAITRLMQVEGRISAVRRARLDQALGGAGWDEAIYRTDQDLLGHEQRRRERGYEMIIRHFEARWRETFGEGALGEGLRLRHGSRLPYLLCFACSNPNPAARNPALRIARHLVRSARHG